MKTLGHEILDIAKKCQIRRMDADGVVCDSACWVFQIEMNGSGTGAATASVYDGHNTTGTPVADLRTITSLSQPYDYWPPKYLERGCYVDVGANVTSVIFHFIAIKE